MGDWMERPTCADCATVMGERARGCKSGYDALPCSRCGRMTTGRVAVAIEGRMSEMDRVRAGLAEAQLQRDALRAEVERLRAANVALYDALASVLRADQKGEPWSWGHVDAVLANARAMLDDDGGEAGGG